MDEKLASELRAIHERLDCLVEQVAGMKLDRAKVDRKVTALQQEVWRLEDQVEGRDA